MIGPDKISAIIQGRKPLLIGIVIRLQNDKRGDETLRCKQFLN